MTITPMEAEPAERQPAAPPSIRLHGDMVLREALVGGASIGLPARPRSKKGTIVWLVASQLVLGLLVAVTTALLVWQSREQVLTASRHELQTLALTLADQAERTFEAVDLVETTFVELTRADRIQTPEEFRRVMSSLEVNQQMISHGMTLPQLATMGLADADGMVVNFNKPWPLPTTPVTDRSYFQALKADPSLARVVAEPSRNRWDQQWGVAVAHSITSLDGHFLGVTFAGVLMSYFENLYKTVSNDENTAISLFRRDGVLLARYPRTDDRIGKSFARGEIFKRLQASGAAADVIEMTGQLADGQILIADHTLAHYPMLVTVTTTLSSILAPWRKQTTVLIGSAVILELVLVAVGILMQRQLRAQRMLAEARGAQAEAETAKRISEVARLGAEAELAVGHERERTDRVLHTQAVLFGAALGNMSEVLCLFDAANRLVVGNDRLAEMFGLAAGGIAPGMTIEDMGALLDGDPVLPLHDPRRLHSLILSARAAGRRETQTLDTEDGRRVAVNFAAMANDGWLVTLEDITEQRHAEARIAHMAHHDALTGLPNRLLFQDALKSAMARCRRGERFAVLYLDLDHFKAVNDTLGHPVGDTLLREVTRRLQLAVRETDTIARLGGDEFAIVQSICQPSDTTALARRLIDSVSAPYEFNGNRVIIGVSIGIAIAPDDGEDADEIIRHADLALYRSKAGGRGRYQFFESEMNARMQARRTLDLDLRRALDEGQFRVFYQPLMNIATRTVCGFEALVRWQHPERGMVSPVDFIPLAEETGLIIPLGKWVLRQACADAATWPHGLKVAVNLSPVQFGSPSLLEDVTAAMADAGLSAHSLELEITETAMLEDTEAVLAILHRLRNLGLRIALDDFGTGYSSLSYLQRFPFTKVKIDRSFVSNIGRGGDNDTIVSAVVDLCGRLGMVTTGEGVETVAQLDRLAQLNCTEAQGYLFSRPRPAADVAALLLALNPLELALELAGS